LLHFFLFSLQSFLEHVGHLVPDLWSTGSDADGFEQFSRIIDEVFD